MIDAKELNAIEKLVREEFGGAFMGAPTSYQLFTTEISDTENTSWFEWIGALPRVKEWVGNRQIEQMKQYDYSIKSKNWELTILQNYAKLFDKSKTKLAAMTKQKVAGLGQQFRQDYPAETIISALEAGTVNLAYDGIPFFSNASGVRTIDNLAAGSGTTVDNIIADIKTNRAVMKKFTDDKGRVMNVTPNLAVIPAELEIQFQEITRTKLRSSSDNMFYGALDYVVDGRLTDPSDWYLMATLEFIKPIVCMITQDVQIAVDDMTFKNKSVAIGADASGNVGYSFPFLAMKIVNS